jgi:predicted nucleotidyltransferase component of viral defense system
MYLHQQQDKFRKAIEETSISTGFLQAQIEKDYYLFLILKTLIERTNIPVIFKGGTSLNQSYEIINRFSEDLDLSEIG